MHHSREGPPPTCHLGAPMGARRLPRTTQEPWAPGPDINFYGPPMGARGRGRSWELYGCPGTSYEHPCT